jgi:hypothetical protein
MENPPFSGARLYPKDQPQRVGLSDRVASVPRRRSFRHVAATGLSGTAALLQSSASGLPTVSAPRTGENRSKQGITGGKIRANSE